MASALRFLWLALSGLLLFYFLTKDGDDGAQQLGIKDPERVEAPTRAATKTCDIWTPTVHAVLTTRGATLQSYELLPGKYRREGKSRQLTTTPAPTGDLEYRQQLFVTWNNVSVGAPSDTSWNVAYTSVDYELLKSDGHTCEFLYRDDSVELRKVISATSSPYELKLDATIKNLSASAKTHAVTVDTVDWWKHVDVESKMFRISPNVTHVECFSDAGKTVRKTPDEFEPEDLAKQEEGYTPTWGWFNEAGKTRYAAVANAYFANSIAPVSGPTATCQLLIENRGSSRDSNAGAYYRARLQYPLQTLEPQASETYSVLAYIGPKERRILDVAGGGGIEFNNLIDLGFFSFIAKILVDFLLTVHGVIPNWGIAIIVLTLTARVLLFPLSVPGIKNMIAMRALKPEIDELNKKYKDDAQAKGLAQMELYKKRGVNPLKGCLPQLASMPVWFALYTTLQTAVELYNIPFLWFPDLTEPDPLFLLPLAIGGTYFLQQKLMPMQADPAQQKMMLYFMPLMFTGFMFFLPAGLGVYMFTNSILAIAQQQIVELHVARTTGIRSGGKKGKITVTETDDTATKSTGKGGKKRKSGSEDRALLDKGKA